MTLKEGLEKFNRENNTYFSNYEKSKEGIDFLECHDICHVLFNCNTSLYGEGTVKIWITFGTTLSFKEVTNGYRNAKAFHLARSYSFGHVIKNIFRLVISIPTTIIRARQMSKPWPFREYHSYMNMPLDKIRKEFNIRVSS